MSRKIPITESLRDYVERLRAIGLTAAEQEAVLGKNAAKLLDLSGAAP